MTPIHSVTAVPTDLATAAAALQPPSRVRPGAFNAMLDGEARAPGGAIGAELLRQPRVRAPETTGEAFEAVMLVPFIAAMLPPEDAEIWGGTGGAMWRGLFADAVAGDIARAGGIGIAALVDRTLTPPRPAVHVTPKRRTGMTPLTHSLSRLEQLLDSTILALEAREQVDDAGLSDAKGRALLELSRLTPALHVADRTEIAPMVTRVRAKLAREAALLQRRLAAAELVSEIIADAVMSGEWDGTYGPELVRRPTHQGGYA